jgi:hypothetical protein
MRHLSSLFGVCRPSPPPTAMVALAKAEELTQREEALAAQEEKARISEMALIKVSTDLDAQ